MDGGGVDVEARMDFGEERRDPLRLREPRSASVLAVGLSMFGMVAR